jgi:hypothetical protein
MRLTIGMPSHNNFGEVFATVQALRLYHNLKDYEILIIDNFGDPILENFVKKHGDGIVRYEKFTENIGPACAKNMVFELARGEMVLCMDSHVFLALGALDDISPTDNLIQGPLLYNNLRDYCCEWLPVWRGHMWGIWGPYSPLNKLRKEPFEIWGMGCGCFLTSKSGWLGFNKNFRGFGGEEGYLQEKYRKAGRKVICNPKMVWVHQFDGKKNTYPLKLSDRVRNYVIGFNEIGLDIDPVIQHFGKQLVDQAKITILRENMTVKKEHIMIPDKTNSKQAIVFLSNNSNVNEYMKIKKASENIGDAVFAYHSKGQIPDAVKSINPYIFTDDIISDLKYKNVLDNFLPHNTHFPLLKFYLDNPNYEYYWLIEDDARYNGDWKTFFDSITSDEDFITSGIRAKTSDSMWYWWSSLNHPTFKIPDNELLASFNPICRLSNRAVKLINQKILDGWTGHQEVLMPTLLKQEKFTIKSFGMEKTIIWKPLFEEMTIPNVIYHPVKNPNITFNQIDVKNIKIIPFIFNWKNQLDKTLHLQTEFKQIFDGKIHVINNDSTVDEKIRSEWITIPETHFYTKKFLKAVEIFLKTDGDFMFIESADASCDNWKGLIDSIYELYDKYKFGILVPYIDYSPWTWTAHNEYENNIFKMKNTDTICWFIHRSVIEEFIKYKCAFDDSNFGWGVDLTLCGISWFYGHPVIQNKNYIVKHPKGSGYNSGEAAKQMTNSFSKLPTYLNNYKDFVYSPDSDMSNIRWKK